MNPIGCNSDQLKDIMVFCGYQYLTIPDKKKLYFLGNKKKEKKKIIKNYSNKKTHNKKIKIILKEIQILPLQF